MTDDREQAVARHYGFEGLKTRIFDAIAAAGLDPARLTPADLAPIDEFHMGGRVATAEIVGRLGLRAGDRVLDIGSGIGGLVRHLAGEVGARATGVDLTPEFVEIAEALTAATGLADRADFVVGSALALPFPDAAFDAALTFHVAMNIADRAGMYREAARVLRTGGVLAIYDVVKGPTPGMLFPVPWAASAETSHLLTLEEQSSALRTAGFVVEVVEDRTPLVREHHRRQIARAERAGPAPVLGLHLLHATGGKETSRNMIAMTEAGQIGLGLTIARRGS